MNQKKTGDMLAYAAILLGLSAYVLWLLRVRTVFAQQADSLPVDVALLPTQALYWISLAVIALPFTIPRLSKWVRGLSLALTLFIILFAFPLHSPFNIPHSRDPQYSLQAAELIAEDGFWSPNAGTGQAKGYSNFPSLAVYHVMLSELSGIGITTAVMWGIALLRLAMLPLLLFLLFGHLLKSDELGVLAMFIYFTNPSLTNHPHYEGMAIVFMIAIGYLIFVSELRFHWRTVALAGLLCIATVFTHHLTSYITFAWLLALCVLAFIFSHARSLPFLGRIGHSLFSERIEWKKPLVVLILFMLALGGWSLTYGKSHYQYYAGGLNNALVDVIFPEEAAEGQLSPPAPAAANQGELPLSFATFEEENPQPAPPLAPGGDEGFSLGAIGQSAQGVMALLTQGNFKPAEILAVGIGALAAVGLILFGLLRRQHELTFFEVANFLFFSAMTLAGFMLVVVSRYNIVPRMFEFTYLGFTTLLLAGIVALYRDGALRQLAFSAIVIMLLITGNLLVSSGQQRALYVPTEKVTLDSSVMFLSPSTYGMSQWARERFEGRDVVGEAFIFDTIGAYGRAEVHVYEPVLLRGVYQALTFTDRTRQLILWDNANAIFTHKYLEAFGSGVGGPYRSAAIRKFDETDWLNRVYDSNTIQAYYVREHLQ